MSLVEKGCVFLKMSGGGFFLIFFDFFSEEA